mgnify:CR=1 FL=1
MKQFWLNTLIIAATLSLGSVAAFADDINRIPVINGTLRAKYEYQPQISAGRFEVRNARVGITGLIIRGLSYKAEIDLCDEGKIKMLDAFIRYSPLTMQFTLGQMRVPFTIEAPRSPHLQYFANRSFIAKQAANIRDVGFSASYTFKGNFPVNLTAGIFNSSGLTNQKDFWTKSYNFSFKALLPLFGERLVISPSLQRARPGDVYVMLWDVGAYWDDKLWHVEFEYLRKNYEKNQFPGVNVFDIFASRFFPIKHTISGISALARYDFMGDHSTGVYDDNKKLIVNDPRRHRLTVGATMHIGVWKIYGQLRINYEKYFYAKDAVPATSERDKIVAELMVHF